MVFHNGRDSWMKQALREIKFNLPILVAVYNGQPLAPVYKSVIVTIDRIGSEESGIEGSFRGCGCAAWKCIEAHRPSPLQLISLEKKYHALACRRHGAKRTECIFGPSNTGAVEYLAQCLRPRANGC